MADLLVQGKGGLPVIEGHPVYVEVLQRLLIAVGVFCALFYVLCKSRCCKKVGESLRSKVPAVWSKVKVDVEVVGQGGEQELQPLARRSWSRVEDEGGAS